MNSELSFLKGRARFQYLAYCRAPEEFIEGRPDLNIITLEETLGIPPTLFKDEMRKAGQDWGRSHKEELEPSIYSLKPSMHEAMS